MSEYQMKDRLSTKLVTFWQDVPFAQAYCASKYTKIPTEQGLSVRKLSSSTLFEHALFPEHVASSTRFASSWQPKNPVLIWMHFPCLMCP